LLLSRSHLFSILTRLYSWFYIVDDLRDLDPTNCFSAHTTLSNVVHILELTYFTYKGPTLSTKGDQPWFYFDRSKYSDLTYRVRFRLERIRDSIEDFYVGPLLPQ
jgi:hypothetical protein